MSAVAIPKPRDAATRAPAPAFARVAVARDAEAMLGAWAELEACAPASIYQTRAWLRPWIATLGAKAGLEPFFVAAFDRTDRPVALLAFGLVARAGIRRATWLGGTDANFNMPLVRPGTHWPASEVRRLLRAAARAAGHERPDLFDLRNQPFAWDGRPNPLAALPHQAAPSAAYGTDLCADAETLFAAKLSKDTRKKLRKKEARLAAAGALAHVVATDAPTRQTILDAFVAQKVERFRAQGIVSEFDTPEMRAFLEHASAPDGDGIELHALTCGERIVAVYGGAVHGGQWSGMFNSFDADEEIAKSSPGDLLLLRIVAKACADGMARFDLGVGEARYKASLCDERIALFDLVVPVSLRGRIAAALVARRQDVKRIVKSHPRLFALAKRVRARLR